MLRMNLFSKKTRKIRTKPRKLKRKEKKMKELQQF